MKKIVVFALAILSVVAVSGNPFEGKITYQNSFKSKLPNATDEQFDSMMGTKQVFYIKGGDYKSEVNGTYLQWQLYTHKENKLYTQTTNSETLLWNDVRVNGDSIISAKLNKGVIEILGYTCDELILTCKSGTQKYYFNSKLGVDAKLFANHAYANWYDYLKQANAVPLKMIIDNLQYTMESIATEVKPMKLEDKEFKLPANAKTEKSPY